MTEIPANCLFNKKQTGCGATELAIRNNIPTIIAMPYVALVKNKTIYRKDDISVQGVARKGVEAIELKLKGYEATEIAKHYDTSVNNVNAWISRARSKLRNEPALLEILY